MSYFYTNPERETVAHALPDAEVYYHEGPTEPPPPHHPDDAWKYNLMPTGWYWWPCFPGCLPDGDPCGPFDTEAEAIADARYAWELEEESAI